MIPKLKTFTPAYMDLQRELHARPSGYGGKGSKWLDAVVALKARIGASSVLDYGCGRGTLGEALQRAGHECREYDPAIPARSRFPLFADLVVCTDVLEHIEPDLLSNVLEQLRSLARKAVLFSVALDPSNKTMRDGRNAHLILESPDWWQTTVHRAGFRFADDLLAMIPLPVAYGDQTKRQKRWIAIGLPQEEWPV